MIPQKIAHMIRMACASGTPAEAANAALMACRALMASGVIPKDSSEPARESRERSSSPFEDAKKADALHRQIHTLEREKRDLVAANQRLVAQIDELKNPPRSITAKFNSHCRKCQEIIHEGEKCWWQPGVKGACCLSCGHS